MITEWKKTDNELPPIDGVYQISNQPGNIFDITNVEYDGYGFSYCGKYVTPQYWRHLPPKVKRYGKIKKEDL